MGNKALQIILTILMCLGMDKAYGQAQGSTITNQGNYQLFSNNYNFQDDLLSDVQKGHLGAVWRARIYGEAVEFENQSAQVGTVDLFMESKYKLLDNLEALVFFRGKFQSGRSQDFYGDLEPNSGIFLREGAIKYSPFEFIALKAGVINQDWLDMPQILWRQSFPGASVRLSHSFNEKFQVAYAAQYLIPTSQTLSTRTVGKEETPSFTTHTVSANLAEKDKYSITGSASLFEFENLPSFVAFQSRLRGNTLTNLSAGPNNSAFQYQFKGWYGRIGGSYMLTDVFEPSAVYSVVINDKAPNAYNAAQLISVGTRIHTENYVYFIGYENYFAESDVTPSFYNSAGYGNTNRKGDGIDSFWQLKKHNFRIRAQYYRSKVLNRIGSQEDQDYYYIGVETGYDRI